MQRSPQVAYTDYEVSDAKEKAFYARAFNGGFPFGQARQVLKASAAEIAASVLKGRTDGIVRQERVLKDFSFVDDNRQTGTNVRNRQALSGCRVIIFGDVRGYGGRLDYAGIRRHSLVDRVDRRQILPVADPLKDIIEITQGCSAAVAYVL